MPKFRRSAPTVWIAVMTLAFNGCVYFNTYFNAQKAYDQAIRMHDKRLDKNAEDSTLASPEEKVKLERSIAKASKVLELYPEEKKYQPKALFLIGESYLAMGEYSKAILKYEELQRFYPQAQEMRLAEFHRAKCLFLNGQYPFARTALEKVLETTQDAHIRAEALLYLAKLEVENDSPALALELYEKLLKDQAHTVEAKAHVRYEAAKLAFELKQWERARSHALAPETKRLPTKLHYRIETLAAECLYRLDRPADGIAEFEHMLKNRLYTVFFPEIQIKLAQGYFQIGKADRALEILAGVPKLAPKTAYAAEAFFRLGEYQFMQLKNEKEAKIFYDSAAAAGSQFEYAIKASERSQALGRLADLRQGKDSTAMPSHYRDFMIAELFLFKLDNIDSALGHLDQIVSDPRQDSTHTMRAAYARAFIQEEFKHSKPVGDSLYRYVLEKYPSTEYAKQAERNLGLKPTVKTAEDEAHKIFLEAEALRFSGGDMMSSVIPAYTKVVDQYGSTLEAAKAQFVVAMLYEQNSHGEEPLAGSRDSAISAFSVVRERFPKTEYFHVADTKLQAAGIKPQAKPLPGKVQAGNAPAVSTNGVPPSSGTAVPAPSTTASGTDTGNTTGGQPGSSSGQSGHGQREYSGHGMPPASESTAPTDTGNYVPEGKVKEELDNGYDNVEQY